VRPNRALEVELNATPNPVGAGEVLTYTLSFGNRGVSLVANATLQLPLPAGTSFQSASDGGTVSDGVVTWSLGDLVAGVSGVRTLLVNVSASAVEGTPISAQAILRVDGAEARADAFTRVENAPPLTVSVDVQPNPVMQGQTLLVSFTVTNAGPVSLFGVTARVRVPSEVTPFSAALTSGGGRCTVGASSGCDNLEPVRWTIGTAEAGLGAGESVVLTMPPPVPMGASAPPDGTLITFEADATADEGSQAFARPSVRVE
jgi:uncharacterized repeat protein (TIGR01451 family)